VAAVVAVALAAAWAMVGHEDDPVLAGGGTTAAGGPSGPSGPSDPSDTDATTVAPTTLPATTTTARDPFLGNGQAVTLAFGGDTHFEGRIADRLATDPGSIFGGFAPVLAGADLAVVNMETAIGVGGTPAPKEFTFQAPPAALEAFLSAGVDVVSAANNHGLDFGPESLEETLAAEASSGLPIIGIGREENEAYAPFIADVRGQRIAVIAATQVLDDSLVDAWTATADHAGLASAKRVERLTAEVAAARAVADTVVVFLHWGIETQTCPSGDQQTLADALVAAGADVVVGSHAHRVQGGGRLGDAVVDYGLGNFAFYTSGGEGARTGVFTVTITGRRVDGYEWVPGRIVDQRPEPLTGDAAAAESAAWDAQRGCTGLTP
jgi:poly-gamma-glutamate capsule biosynthesis protein CapA/YwtB (metallophosphatase superfamily)